MGLVGCWDCWVHVPPGLGDHLPGLGVGLSGSSGKNRGTHRATSQGVSSTSSKPCEPHLPLCRTGITEAAGSQGDIVRSKQGHSHIRA